MVSCSMAAGRRTSVETTTGWRPWRASIRASLPVVVVLPEPCRPSMRMTRGVRRGPPTGRPWRRRTAPSSSSRTILTTCCAGDRLRLHRLIEGAIADAIDERLDHLQVDVGFEQRGADVAQHALGRLGREADLAPQRLEDVLEPGAQGVEHGRCRGRRRTVRPGPTGRWRARSHSAQTLILRELRRCGQPQRSYRASYLR